MRPLDKHSFVVEWTACECVYVYVYVYVVDELSSPLSMSMAMTSGPGITGTHLSLTGKVTAAAGQPMSQYGPLLQGPGALRRPVPYQLRKLRTREKDRLDSAKKCAVENSDRAIILRQALQIQQQVFTLHLMPFYSRDEKPFAH